MNKCNIFCFIIVALSLESSAVQAQLPIEAKGIWIWKVWTANSGDLNQVVSTLKKEGITWLVIKMGDSDSYYNLPNKALYGWAANYGGMDSVIAKFHHNNIKIMGYQYVYGIPHWGTGMTEADVADSILNVNNIDGLIIDAEIQYDTLTNRYSIAKAYLDSVHAHHPNSFVGLTSWARVGLHSTFPWTVFLDRVNVNMPQTYWAARSLSPTDELSRMSSDFLYYTNQWVKSGDSAANKPIMPIGQASYFGYGNRIQRGDIRSFCDTSQHKYNYKGVSLWEYTQIDSAYIWDEYAAAWQTTSVFPPVYVAHTFKLYQNYPNPFNPATTIRFVVPNFTHVNLSIFDIIGRKVVTLVNRQMQPGEYSEVFDAKSLPSGVYFCRLTAGGSSISKPMVLIK
ncbi:MAG: T9SS type A sorting domain-containing protein [Candidatus Kryptoniota bacterium]